MAITNYTELQAAIAAWMKRADITSMIPDFIALAEARIARALMVRVVETEVELSAVAGSRYVALPDGFRAPIALRVKTSTHRGRLPQQMPQDQSGKAEAGPPSSWAIDGTNIAFDRPAESAWAFDFRYTTGLSLSGAAPTNYILTRHPDVYLFGALVEAAQYTLDSQLSAMAEARFQAAVADAGNEEHASRSGASLITEFGWHGQDANFNITEG